MALSNLKKKNDATSGTGKILFAPFANITAHPTVGTYSVVGDTEILTTAPTFATNKGFIDFGGEVDLGELKASLKGEYGSTTQETTVTMKINGITAKNIEQIKLAAKDELALIIKDPDCGATGNPLYVGCDCKGARITDVQWTSGKQKGGGEKGAVITFMFIGLPKEAGFTVVADSSTAV